MNKEYPVGNMNKQYMKISTKSTWTYRQKAHKKVNKERMKMCAKSKCKYEQRYMEL